MTKGLAYEIKELEKVARIKEKAVHDALKERQLIEAYKNYSEEQYKKSLKDREDGLDPTQKTLPDALESTRKPLKLQSSMDVPRKRGRPHKINPATLKALDKSMAESKSGQLMDYTSSTHYEEVNGVFYERPKRKPRSDKGQHHAKRSKT